MPLAEQRRLATAAHLALQALLHDNPQAAWLDLPAAVAVAAKVLEGIDVEDDVRQAVEQAGKALLAIAMLPTPTDEAKAASTAFLPYYEAALATVTWRRLIDAQRAVAAAWAAHGAK